jgi:hypothetical protein
MVIGKGYTQPDKAGSFGIELVKMYQLTGKRNYLDAAVAIANTLAKHTKPGDADNSPLPFKVNALPAKWAASKATKATVPTPGCRRTPPTGRARCNCLGN